MQPEVRTYSVPEFRDNLREALNHVEAGGIVKITRYSKVFVLVKEEDVNGPA